MNKRIVQIDDYDILELWANGECQLRLMWDQERKKIDTLVAGPLSVSSEPGIIRALKEEYLLDE